MFSSPYGRRSLVGAFIAGFLPLYTLVRWVPALWFAVQQHTWIYALGYPIQAITATTAALVGVALVHRRARRVLDATDAVTTRQTVLIGALSATLASAIEWTVEATPIPMPLSFDIPVPVIIFASWTVMALATGCAGALAATLAYLPWVRRAAKTVVSPGPAAVLTEGDTSSLQTSLMNRSTRVPLRTDT